MPRPRKMPRRQKKHLLKDIIEACNNIFPRLGLLELLVCLIFAVAVWKACHHDFQTATVLYKLAKFLIENA